MKKHITSLFMASIIGFLAPLLAFSAEIITAQSKMTKVELFHNGAQVYKEVTFTSEGQVVTIVVKDIPANIDPSTIRAKALNKEKIVSISFETDYKPSQKEKERSNSLKDSLEELSLTIALRNSELAAIQVQENLLSRNMDVIDNQHGSEELEKVLALNARERTIIKKRIVQIAHEIQKLKSKRDDLERAYERMGNIDRPLAGKIKIELVTKPNIASKIEVSYLVPDAWWSPVYDIRVENIFKPIELEFRAEVFQKSFEDWDDVELHFFNNNPFLQGALDELQPWKLEYGSYPPIYADNAIPMLPPSMLRGEDGAISGVVTDEQGLPIPFANVALKQHGKLITGASTDFDGMYAFNDVEPGFYDLEITSLGFVSQRLSSVRVIPTKTTSYICEMDNSAITMETYEVVEYSKPLIQQDGAATRENVYVSDVERRAARSVSELAATVGGTYSVDGLNVRGGRSDANYYYIDGIKVRGSSAVPRSSIEIASAGLSFAGSQDELRMEFTAPGKQTVPSSDKIKLIYLKSETVSAFYVYRTVPKIEPSVYLYAEISDWESLDLLSGKVNLFYNNTFVGETFIDANNTDDTLAVSLGLDHDINVKRERLKDEVNEPTFGSNTVSIGWKLTIKNNKDYPVNIRLNDQIPISRNNAIEVELMNPEGAELEAKSGELTWDLTLGAHSSDQRSFRYKVKYPRGMAFTME